MTAHYCYWAFEALPRDRAIKEFLIDYRLNERHYGTLQGYSKREVQSGKYGHGSSTVQLWRRGWYAVPPLLSQDDSRRRKELNRFINVCGGDKQNIPRGESLDQVAKTRIQPFVEQILTPTLNKGIKERGGRGGTALIVAHANSLRALIGVFANVENDPVALKRLERLRIPTGAPLVLKFQALPDGRTRICGLDGVPYTATKNDDDSSLSSSEQQGQPHTQQSDLPVWPLGCIPN
jgi:2,3-bisphosphoglycerate-dependent phosphoglycerate mutase